MQKMPLMYQGILLQVSLLHALSFPKDGFVVDGLLVQAQIVLPKPVHLGCVVLM